MLDDRLVLVRLPAFSHGRESSPEYFERPVSHSIALRLRDNLSSSSSVDNGRTNSRDVPPGALTTQPRMTSLPVPKGFPTMLMTR